MDEELQRLLKPLFKKAQYNAQSKRLYLNRAFGGDCHRCDVDGDIAACTATR
jgi:hypothetical protein